MSNHEEIRAALAAGPTPGEWAWGPAFDNDGTPESIINALGGAAVVAVALDFGDNNPTWREANARLIAACNPQAIAALIADYDALLADRDRLEAEVEAWRTRFPDFMDAIDSAMALADGEGVKHG